MNYPFQKTLVVREGEYFRGGAVAHGVKMPLCSDSKYAFDVNENRTDNQVNGLFVSTQGRYVYADGEFAIEVAEGKMKISSSAPIVTGEAGGTLKGAYLAAMKYVKKETPRDFPRDLLKKPQFCTWVEMGVNVSLEKILRYADVIEKSGFPHDLLIIDDGWSVDYGDWRFDTKKIPDPKRMIEQLHKKGFRVSLWVVPFVNAAAKDYALLKENGALICDENGEPKMKSWWNGESALLDFTSPFAREYFTRVLNDLMQTYGADGFKFDAGDEKYYSFSDKTYVPATPAKQCALYGEIAKRYKISEVRSGFMNGGSHLITRLGDKRRSWTDENGIRALIPNMIQAGLCCYPFSCADMIGGGNIADFEAEGRNDLPCCDDGAEASATPSSLIGETELAARFCQCNALMPAMQFSCAYWEKNKTLSRVYKECIALHEQMSAYLDELISQAIETGEPILRCIEYEFPHQGYHSENQAFMLGEKYLVKPVIESGVKKMKIRLPRGARWKYMPNGATFCGGETAEIGIGAETLPYFERLKEE